MCLTNETIDELHAITSAIKDVQTRRDSWIADYDARFSAGNAMDDFPISLTRIEAERIFADRIAAHEARLKELGWSKVNRVESTPL